MRAHWRTLTTILILSFAGTACAQRGGREGKPPADKKDSKKDAEAGGPTKVVVGERAPELYAANWANADGTPTLDRFKNRILVLFFFRTDDASADSINALNELHKKLAKNGVIVIGLTPQKKEAAESAIKGKEIKFIVGYEAKTDERYQVSSFPTVYLVDTIGNLVNRFHPQDDLEDKILAQIAKTPPAGADASAMKSRLDQAKSALKNKEPGRAFTLAKDVQKVTDATSALGKSVEDVLKQITTAAEKWLDEAKEATKGNDYEKASRILAEISVRFSGEKVATSADSEIGKLMGDGKIKPILKLALDDAKGRLLNDQAADHETGQRYLEALKIYRDVTEQYADTDAGKAAQKSIERINGDPKVQESIRSMRAADEAERWLDLADRFARVEMYDKAREFYQRTIDTHPGTRAAGKAKERLAKLPETTEEEAIPPAEDEEESS